MGRAVVALIAGNPSACSAIDPVIICRCSQSGPRRCWSDGRLRLLAGRRRWLLSRNVSRRGTSISSRWRVGNGGSSSQRRWLLSSNGRGPRSVAMNVVRADRCRGALPDDVLLTQIAGSRMPWGARYCAARWMISASGRIRRLGVVRPSPSAPYRPEAVLLGGIRSPMRRPAQGIDSGLEGFGDVRVAEIPPLYGTYG